MSDEPVERIVVTVDDRHLAAIQSVATALQSAGMAVNEVMAMAGIITGEVAPAKMQDLKQVSGVVEVEVDREMHAL